MKTGHLVIGSRSSKLAMVQTEYVRDKLKGFYPAWDFEIRTIKTTGDKITDVSLSKIGDKGLFTKEIEEALLNGEVDLAVHSMKDLPTQLPRGLKIAAVTGREDPRDVLVSREVFTLKTLPALSRVGTSSLRRRAQLLHIRKDVAVMDLRGNLDTRLKKLEEGLYDAIVLAYAGIKRLGKNGDTSQKWGHIPFFRNSSPWDVSPFLKMGCVPNFSPISTEDMLPQAGQGALGIEALEDNREAIDMAKALNDADSHLCIDAERALLSGLEGGCQVPIGVIAFVDGDRIRVRAGVFSLDGKSAIKDEISGKKIDAKALGRQLAEKILEKDDARQILEDIRKCVR